MEPYEMKPHERMMQLITSQWVTAPIYAAAKLGIADLLSDGPKGSRELASETGAHEPTLYRVMRALSSVGIFQELGDKAFALTPMAECLKSGAMRPLALMFLADWHDRAFSGLLHGVMTGETPFDKAFGVKSFQWLEQNPEAAKALHESQMAKALSDYRLIVDSYDFSRFESITDVGGGCGALVVEILKANPSLTGCVAELRSGADMARQYLEANKMASRCRVVECDFFHAVPQGGDAYALANVLHDWDDEHCLAILGNCRKAMRPGAKLLVLEYIVPEGNEFSVAKLLDMEMFVMSNGQERTESQFKALFDAAGFELSEVLGFGDAPALLTAVRR